MKSAKPRLFSRGDREGLFAAGQRVSDGGLASAVRYGVIDAARNDQQDAVPLAEHKLVEVFVGR